MQEKYILKCKIIDCSEEMQDGSVMGIDSYLGDTAGSVPDHPNKVTITTKRVT